MTFTEGRPAEPGSPAPARRIVVTAPGVGPHDPAIRDLLAGSGLIADIVGPRGGRTPEDMADICRGAVGVVASADPFTDLVFREATQLRVVARLGVGTDSIDVEAATRHGVLITTTPGLNDETCADHALALMLATLRRIPEHDVSVRAGEWNRGGALTPRDLHRKRVGIIGFGRIGRAVARRLEGFDVELRIYDPNAPADAVNLEGGVDELLQWADIVTLHAPLLPETTGLINDERLRLMRRDAVVINTSRGGLVDQAALVRALREGRIGAAGLDVFKTEPPHVDDLAQLPNVVLSPHIGGLSREAISAMGQRCIAQIVDVLDGLVPLGAINPAAVSVAVPRGKF